MTIIFGYFQYLDYEQLITRTIPKIIYAIVYIIANYFIIRSSRTHQEEKEKPKLLFYIGLINIIFLIIPFLIPTFLLIGETEIEIIFEIIYVIFLGLIQSLPFLITYGILMFKFGKLNQERYNIYLKVSAILWIFSYGIRTITLDTYLYNLIFRFTSISLITPLSIIMSVFGIIGLIGWAIFIIHSIKNKDNNLLIAGILVVIAFIIGFIYNMFLPSLLGI